MRSCLGMLTVVPGASAPVRSGGSSPDRHLECGLRAQAVFGWYPSIDESRHRWRAHSIADFRPGRGRAADGCGLRRVQAKAEPSREASAPQGA